MTSTPLVSIITPNYNGAKFLKETIESVLAQTFDNWEMLIIDDGSYDDSDKIIESYSQRDHRIKFLRTDLTKFPKLVKGPGAARNTGIDASAGRYIAFLDSDDLWHKSKLERQLEFMQHNDSVLSYSWYEIIDEQGKKVGEHTPLNKKLSYKDLLKDCKIGCLTAMYDSKKIGKEFINLNKYDQYADFSLWLKITKRGYFADCLQDKLSYYRLASGSISANKIKAIKHQWNILRNVEKLSFFIALYNFFFYFAAGITKKLRYVIPRLLKTIKNR